MEKKEFSKYYTILFLFILIYISFLIVKPFLKSILAATILAYLFHPLFKKIKGLVKNETVSALIVTILIILIILVPLTLIAKALLKESIGIINNFNNGPSQIISNYITENSWLGDAIPALTRGSVEFIKNHISEVVINLPSMLLSLLVTVFSLFYLLMSGEKLVKIIKEKLPIQKKDELVKHIGDAAFSIVYGLFITALLAFFIALIGFKIIGIESPFILSLIISLAVFLPLLAPAMVWITVATIRYLSNDLKSAVYVVILGAILTILESFLKPKIIGDRSKIHPAIILLGILGGIPTLGFVGIVAGPVILSSLIIIIKEYLK